MNKKPIFEIIADRLRQTEFKDDDIITLGKDFSLPSDEKGLRYVDGASVITLFISSISFFVISAAPI